MRVTVLETPDELGREAARRGAQSIRAALRDFGRATIIVATGASQFATLTHLVVAPEIDWGRVDAFHLDEYLGLDADHPASFRRFLRERFVDRLPTPLGSFAAIDAAGDPHAVCRELAQRISSRTVDVAFIGIGENGHLAFNDPPADFETTAVYHVVQLDEACRRQQLGEGWFPTLDDVPAHAISMTVPEILRARHIVCSVPDLRKARAVHDAVRGAVDPQVPASALQRHANVDLLLDLPAATLLGN